MGFEPFEQRIEIVAGKETSLVVSLVPTIETKAAYQESARTRRVVGWSVVEGGALVTAGSVIYAVLTRNDVSKAQADLDGQLVVERTPTANCYNDPSLLPAAVNRYMALGCGERKAFFQDNLDSAKLQRRLAYGVTGLGVVVAGVGTYLLATGSGDKPRDPPLARISFWGDGRAGGVSVAGRF